MQMTSSRRMRLLGIVILVIVCAGAIGYSARLVRYPVDKAATSEFTVTELSLTHSVERGSDGKLTNPYVEKTAKPASSKPRTAVAKTSTGAKQTGTSILKKEIKPKPVVKKPVAKKLLPRKPPTKKLTTKKPVSDRPPVKKPVNTPPRPKACPT